MLYALLLFVGTLCLLDLILTLGVIRRLREHSDLIAKGLSGKHGEAVEEKAMLGPGQFVGDFVTTSLDGEPVSRDLFAQNRLTLVGFFSSTCPSCQTTLPRFREYATTMSEGRQAVLAVIAGDDPKATAMADSLQGIATVVREPLGGPLGAVFSVQMLPAMGLVKRDGAVLVSGYKMDDLPVFEDA